MILSINDVDVSGSGVVGDDEVGSLVVGDTVVGAVDGADVVGSTDVGLVVVESDVIGDEVDGYISCFKHFILAHNHSYI